MFISYFSSSPGSPAKLLLTQRFDIRPMMMCNEATEQKKNTRSNIAIRALDSLKNIKVLLIQRLYQIVSVLCASALWPPVFFSTRSAECSRSGAENKNCCQKAAISLCADLHLFYILLTEKWCGARKTVGPKPTELNRHMDSGINFF